jgi:act minimal PKS chain-length factor (CLF/KS beta)
MQVKSGLLSTRDDASRAYLPFDTDACGYVPGEGGAILVVEDAKAAQERGAPRIYGEIAGYAATFDPAPGSGRKPGLGRAARLAISDAGLSVADIDVVFADAAGVPGLDRIEATTITALFGPRGVPVTAPKTMTGRLYSGGAALDVVTALLSIRDQVIPPTINVAKQVPGDDLDLVLGEPRRTAVRTVLVLARGHGGFNAAMVIRDTESHPSQPTKETPDERTDN